MILDRGGAGKKDAWSGASARADVCRWGDPPPAPRAVFLAAGRLPPQPPTTPLRGSVPHDAAFVLRCLLLHTSATRVCTHHRCRASGGDEAPFSFSSAHFNSGGRERADHRAPGTIYLRHRFKSIPSLETILYTARPFLERHLAQRIHLTL